MLHLDLLEQKPYVVFLYDHELHEVYVLDVYCICYHFLNSLNQNNPLSNFKINSKKTTKVAVGIIAMWSAECYGRYASYK